MRRSKELSSSLPLIEFLEGRLEERRGAEMKEKDQRLLKERK